MKLYKYTILEQGGGIRELPPCKKKEFRGAGGLYDLLGASMIEIIPPDYYKSRKYGHCTMYGDEEGRFNTNNHRNPHFDTIVDGYDGSVWDVVGDIVKEEVAK